jgi:hypothetical protein
VLAQIAEPRARRQHVAHDVSVACDNSTCPPCASARSRAHRPMCRPEIIVVAQLGLAGMQRHADTQHGFVGPRFGEKRMLQGAGRRDRVGRAAKYGEHAVALTAALDHRAVVLCDDLGHQNIVPGRARVIGRGCCSQSRVLPSMSVNRNVTVPVGSDGAAAATGGSAGSRLVWAAVAGFAPPPFRIVLASVRASSPGVVPI